MDSIDVHDLPEEEARLVAAFVEFLRRRQRQQAQRGEQPEVIQTPEARPEQPRAESPFAVWPLGVKGTLSREEIYDYL